MDTGVEVYLHGFLTPALDGSEWLISHPGHFTPRETATVTTAYGAVWAPEPVWTLWRKALLLPAGNRTTIPRSPSP
jgi:hypothetical protein